MPKQNIAERRKRLKQLMNKLESMLANRDNKKQKVKEFLPLIQQVEERESEE
jgi:hypothetical protein